LAFSPSDDDRLEPQFEELTRENLVDAISAPVGNYLVEIPVIVRLDLAKCRLFPLGEAIPPVSRCQFGRTEAESCAPGDTA